MNFIISIKEFDPDNDSYRIPDEIKKDWKKFSKLYFDTFGVQIGKNYKTYCSKGIKRL